MFSDILIEYHSYKEQPKFASLQKKCRSCMAPEEQEKSKAWQREHRQAHKAGDWWPQDRWTRDPSAVTSIKVWHRTVEFYDGNVGTHEHRQPDASSLGIG
jgi:hypothetical protein